jgi:alkylation response protein AidB-like acyl-CoA dehydrogenase
MQIYDAPIKDMRFALEAFDYNGKVNSLPAYEDYDLDMVMDLAEQTGKFCSKEMLPLNRKGDEQGLRFDAETYSVKVPDGFVELYKKTTEQGAMGMTHPVEYGGAGAPDTLHIMMMEMATAANKSFSMCTGLTHGLIDALLAHGSDELKQTFLPKLVTGEWSGTMCLTEPQCGTDLGLMTTKAVPTDDHYRLTGTKIWITFGDHDMTSNIVHLVLARLPDAPEGIKGISLFVVPKFDHDGSRNPIYCTGLEHKMGIHASPTCVINMEDAKGWLVGEPHKGMRAMFTMMNAARLQVGMEGVALAEISYQTALAFAKDRRQGKALNPTRREEGAKADTILVHPDVRRMLLNIKSTNEGMRGLALWMGMLLDVMHHHEDQQERQKADDMVALLTPVIKSFCTEKGFENVSEALQVCGGAGYTTDWSIEQYLRDLRIALIYEGTNHIQALDLVGRKLPRGNGRLFMAFNEVITGFIRENKDDERMGEFLTPLKEVSKKLGKVTMALSMKGMQDPEEAGAVASPYLNLFAYTAMSYVWCVLVKEAMGREGSFYETKIKTGRYFFNNVLPQADGLVAIIESGKDNIMAFDAEEF